MEYPKISVIMPIYNEEKKIQKCLESIREQDYPQDKIEIVFVDDDSTDKSLEIAKKYKIKYVRNGAHDYDIGKSLGIKEATGEYITFLDGDNILPNKDWFKKMIQPLIEDKSIIGSQLMWIKYDKSYPFFDRYCTLYGITDPLTIYLEKRGHLMLWEKKWKLGLVKDNENYSIAEFNEKNLPTIGSVGFTIKKEYLLKTDYDPAFSHLDCMQDLIKLGLKRFAIVKQDIIHLHSSSYSDFIGKLKRNLNIFMRDYKKRRYKWEAPLWKKAYATFAMGTFIIPFYHATRGYLKIHDVAWFAHPFICFSVITKYLKIFLFWKLGWTKN
ncbi:MAG: glycosyltransferase family 2 protein [Candidatus Nanoarchaeia archaeon]|nr:glycosyltransferase family 2 protein [Candidatus Nanoarchaeia archaeon]MDD5358154.1 glycosyltransferase family 2 protein [Candidatus Nanoarchaeia archaeon]MDD5589341.1 glycosyltransferase family 2 protein [Candidatus Nanoarchaeia archaeon]